MHCITAAMNGSQWALIFGCVCQILIRLTCNIEYQNDIPQSQSKWWLIWARINEKKNHNRTITLNRDAIFQRRHFSDDAPISLCHQLIISATSPFFLSTRNQTNPSNWIAFISLGQFIMLIFTWLQMAYFYWGECFLVHTICTCIWFIFKSQFRRLHNQTWNVFYFQPSVVHISYHKKEKRSIKCCSKWTRVSDFQTIK